MNWACRKVESGLSARVAFAKKKINSHLFRSPDREVGENQGKREPPLCENGGSKREHEEEKVDDIMKEGRFQGGDEEQA